MTGFSGCNSYSGTYTIDEDAVRIGRLATTKVACAEDVMAQETAFLAALQGVARIEQRLDSVNLTDRSGSILVALVRPQIAAASASPSATPEPTTTPEPTPEPTASPTPEPTPTPTPEPTPTPTPEPTATPSPSPTPAPSATATPAPTAAPTGTPAASASGTPSTAPSGSPTPSRSPIIPPSVTTPIELPTVQGCELVPVDSEDPVAVIVYPGDWFTVVEPPELVCRYFDPESIPAPADPETLETAVRADVIDTPFADAVTAATDPAVWDIRRQTELTVDGLPALLVEAVALEDTEGIEAGTGRFLVLVDKGDAGTIAIWTTGDPTAPEYLARVALVTLMTALTVFQPAAPA